MAIHLNKNGDIELPASASSKAPSAADIEAEASAALIALGYKPQEAAKMISRVATAGADSETLIKEATTRSDLGVIDCD